MSNTRWYSARDATSPRRNASRSGHCTCRTHTGMDVGHRAKNRRLRCALQVDACGAAAALAAAQHEKAGQCEHREPKHAPGRYRPAVALFGEGGCRPVGRVHGCRWQTLLHRPSPYHPAHRRPAARRRPPAPTMPFLTISSRPVGPRRLLRPDGLQRHAIPPQGHHKVPGRLVIRPGHHPPSIVSPPTVTVTWNNSASRGHTGPASVVGRNIGRHTVIVQLCHERRLARHGCEPNLGCLPDGLSARLKPNDDPSFASSHRGTGARDAAQSTHPHSACAPSRPCRMGHAAGERLPTCGVRSKKGRGHGETAWARTTRYTAVAVRPCRSRSGRPENRMHASGHPVDGSVFAHSTTARLEHSNARNARACGLDPGRTAHPRGAQSHHGGADCPTRALHPASCRRPRCVWRACTGHRVPTACRACRRSHPHTLRGALPVHRHSSDGPVPRP